MKLSRRGMLRSLGLAAFGVATGVKVVQHCAETASGLVEEAKVALSATELNAIFKEMFPVGLDEDLILKSHPLLHVMKPRREWKRPLRPWETGRG